MTFDHSLTTHASFGYARYALCYYGTCDKHIKYLVVFLCEQEQSTIEFFGYCARHAQLILAIPSRGAYRAITAIKLKETH